MELPSMANALAVPAGVKKQLPLVNHDILTISCAAGVHPYS